MTVAEDNEVVGTGDDLGRPRVRSHRSLPLTVDHYREHVDVVNARLGKRGTPADLDRFHELIASAGYEGIELEQFEPGDRDDQIMVSTQSFSKERSTPYTEPPRLPPGFSFR